MKKIHKLVVKSYAGPLIASFFISMFVLLMQFLWRYIEDLVGKGLPYDVIAEILLYACASLVPMALPLSVLLASIMVFGNLAEHNELMAMKSAGISLLRIMQPLIFIAIGLTFFAFYFADQVVPKSNLRMRSLLYDIKNKPPEIIIPTGVFYNELPGYSIKIGRRDHQTKMLYDVLIYDHTSNRGNVSVILAEKGEMYYVNQHQYMILQLYNGAMYEEEQVKKASQRYSYPQRRHFFEEQKIIFDLSGFGLKRTDENLFKNHYQMLSTKDLAFTMDSLNKKIEEQRTNIYQNIKSGNFFRKMYRPNEQQEPYVFPNKRKSIDSLFSTFSKSMKINTLSSAIAFSQNTQSYIRSENQSLKSRRVWMLKHGIEWHRKHTLALACLVLFFIGAPLGAIIRKGGIGMPVVVSVILFILYYILGMIGAKAAEQSQIELWLGMWSSTLLFAPIGLFLTIRALQDKVIIDIDRYIDFIIKPFKILAQKVPILKKLRNKSSKDENTSFNE
ncbi:MAG TPA: LptF/LptG family permease [Salinivirgaceae bacterium]|nr:LptF/LptG family permease [Salinivirgaceae bacterium]